MGNNTSSSALELSGVYEPLVDDTIADEVERRLSEAFHYSKSKSTHKPQDEDELEPKGNSEETEEIAEAGNNDETVNSTDHQCKTVEREFDPFQNLRQIEGWSVIIHPITAEDTLAGISLRYNISTDAIKRANFMTSDDRLISYQKLIIPCGKSPEEAQPQEFTQNEESEIFKSPAHKNRLVQLLLRINSSDIGSCGSEYYLERNYYNIRSAIQEAEDDEQWERNHSKRFSSPIS